VGLHERPGDLYDLFGSAHTNVGSAFTVFGGTWICTLSRDCGATGADASSLPARQAECVSIQPVAQATTRFAGRHAPMVLSNSWPRMHV